ncbi:hypothetical protein Tco_0720605 [Tanacetum coccineum]
MAVSAAYFKTFKLLHYLAKFEAHGAEVSNEDANYKFLRSLPPAWSNLAMTMRTKPYVDTLSKFLRSLPPAWSNLAMTMRTKPDVDTLSIDDLYNNLRVFDPEIQRALKTSSSAQNVAFVSQSTCRNKEDKPSFSTSRSWEAREESDGLADNR